MALPKLSPPLYYHTLLAEYAGAPEDRDKGLMDESWRAWLTVLVSLLNALISVVVPGYDAFTYAAAVTLDVTKGNVHKTTTTNAVGNATINASETGVAGQQLTIIITNDGVGARTITFGTNFKPAATIVGTVNKTATITFASDGTSWWETGRTLLL